MKKPLSIVACVALIVFATSLSQYAAEPDTTAVPDCEKNVIWSYDTGG